MDIALKNILKRALPVALVMLAGFAVSVPTAGAAQFRQLPALPFIPPAITFPGERDILQADLDRLKARIGVYDRKRADYRRECAQRLLSNSVRKRQCSFMAQEIHRDGSRLRTAIGALRNRFGAIERNVLQRRHSGAPQTGAPRSGTGTASTPTDKRPKLIADALSVDGGSWRGVLDHVKAMMDRGAGDPAVRDISAYLVGMHAGRIAADRLENGYYKHGVRRALAGDNWSAALAFAQAARDAPEDFRVFESYADAAGRQHIAPACTKSARCVSGNVAVWAKRFGKNHEQAIKQIVAAGRKGALTPDAVRMLNILKAIAIYAAKKDDNPSDGPTDRPEFAAAATEALEAYRRNERGTAVKGYIRLWKLIEPWRSALFLFRYAEASGSAEARTFLDYDMSSAAVSGIDQEYLAALKSAFANSERVNPFSGRLSQAQIIRLQR